MFMRENNVSIIVVLEHKIKEELMSKVIQKIHLVADVRTIRTLLKEEFGFYGILFMRNVLGKQVLSIHSDTCEN